MKKITQLLSLAMMVCAFSVAAQSTVTGIVTDASMQEPLPGATIIEKGTTNGVSTDFDGKFTLTTKKSSGELVISYVGYTSQTLAFSGNIATITLGSYILTDCFYSFSGNDLRSNSSLNWNIKLLTRDQFF